MSTPDLIARLAADLGADPAPPDPRAIERRLRWAMLGGLALTLALAVGLFGLRADPGAAALSPAGAVKLGGGTAIALGAFALAARLARPGARMGVGMGVGMGAGMGARFCVRFGFGAGSNPTRTPRLIAAWLAVAAVAVALVIALVIALSGAALPGRTAAPICTLSIAALGLAPLAAMLMALRAGASTRPALTGAAAGLGAGAVAALGFAASCPADDPMFVAATYGAALAICAGAGALAGPHALAW